jgi:hypothetical protein
MTCNALIPGGLPIAPPYAYAKGRFLNPALLSQGGRPLALTRYPASLVLRVDVGTRNAAVGARNQGSPIPRASGWPVGASALPSYSSRPISEARCLSKE